MRRRRRPTAIQNRFSIAMAEQAQLTRKEGPWQSYPQRMLKMRARSWTIRDGFADVLRGLHIREEVDDFIETGGLWPQLLASAPEGVRGRPPAARKGAAPPPPAPPQPTDNSPPLSPAQLRGLWESNEMARVAIARLCGPAVLVPAEERLEAAQEARAGRRNDRPPADSNTAASSATSVPEPAAGRVRRRWAVQRPRASQREATARRSGKPPSSQGSAAPAANIAAPPETAEWNRTASTAARPGGNPPQPHPGA